MGTQSFFRWIPTAIILWAFGVIFVFAAGVCALQAAHGSTQVAMIGDAQHTARWFLRGAISDAMIAVCCILGWHLMRRRLPAKLALGAILILVAAFIIGQRSLIYLVRGAGFEYWCDLVFELPFLLYAFIYAFREYRKSAV
jgi:hypothetical protein